MGKTFNKGLIKDDKKERLFKKLKNTEIKNEVQLQAIKNQGEKQLGETKNINWSATLTEIEGFKLSAEGKKLLCTITKIDQYLDTAERACTNTDGKTKYGFNLFASPVKVAEKVYTGDLMSQEAKDNQAQLEILINKLDK